MSDGIAGLRFQTFTWQTIPKRSGVAKTWLYVRFIFAATFTGAGER